MTQRPWYKRYPSDFLNGASKLTLEEKGAYSIIVDLIYDKQSPIDNDPVWLGKIFGCSTKKARLIVKKLAETRKQKAVDKMWITIHDGMIFESRAVFDVFSWGFEGCKLDEKSLKSSDKVVEFWRELQQNNDLASEKDEKKSDIPDTRVQKPYKNSGKYNLKSNRFPDGRIKISAGTYAKIKEKHPSWDINKLEDNFNEMNEGKIVAYPDKAFIGFADTHVKRNGNIKGEAP